MHDGIEFDRNGVPAAALVTDRFLATANAMREMAGVPEYPYLVAPHPLSSLSEEELRAHAERLTPVVAGVLTGQPVPVRT